MQKFFKFLVFSLLFMPASAQIRSDRDLVGKWQGTDMKLEFFNNQRVVMTLPGGKLPAANFNADYMRNPVAITITLTDKGQKLIYKGSLKFIDNENIEVEYFSGGAENVFEKGRTVKLRKQK